MKYLGSIIFLLALSACNGDQNDSESIKCYDSLQINNKTICLDSISESYFKKNRFSFPLRNDTAKIDSSLVQFLSNGILIKTKAKDVVFKNDTSDTDSRVIYYYQKTLLSLGYIHIQGIYYEWTRDFLINLESGKETEFWENPIFSPNRKWILSYSGDLESGEMPNGIQLFSNNAGTITRVFENEITNWAPDDIKWEADTVLLIKRKKLDQNYKESYDYVKMSIK
jgi:hypothetical protein